MKLKPVKTPVWSDHSFNIDSQIENESNEIVDKIWHNTYRLIYNSVMTAVKNRIHNDIRRNIVNEPSR